MTPDMLKLVALALFAVLFTAFTVVVGKQLRTRGRVFVSHTFETHPALVDSVQFLLNLGFYLLCVSLLLWNLGVEPGEHRDEFSVVDLFQSVLVRLGSSILAVAALHSLNVLILSVLHRKQPTAPR
jgi:hypothetical protein